MVSESARKVLRKIEADYILSGLSPLYGAWGFVFNLLNIFLITEVPLFISHVLQNFVLLFSKTLSDYVSSPSLTVKWTENDYRAGT